MSDEPEIPVIETESAPAPEPQPEPQPEPSIFEQVPTLSDCLDNVVAATLNQERMELAKAMVLWNLSRAGVPLGDGHPQQHLKQVKDKVRMVDQLEEMTVSGVQMPGASAELEIVKGRIEPATAGPDGDAAG